MPDRKAPTERPAVRRTETAGADSATLVKMGLADPPPMPSTPPLPGPSPVEQANEEALQTALADAGVTKTGRDEQVIDVLARLDPSDVEAVTRWLTKTRPAEPPPDEPPQR